MEMTAQEMKDEVIEIINEAREEGETDLRQLRYWVESINSKIHNITSKITDRKGDRIMKLWCAMCGKYGDHQSGSCPELRESSSVLNESASYNLSEALGIETSWPTSDIIDALCEAADILLHKKDYDGDGWENIQYAMERGRKRAELLRTLN